MPHGTVFAVNGGVVLAGGRSSRMGSPKADLAWHGSTLVRRVAGLVSHSVEGPVVVVRSPGQPLPVLPPRFEVAEDAREGLGPLAGLSAGLGALADRCEEVFVASTDMPLLHPAFVRAVMAALGPGVDICVPVVRTRLQPLAGGYRVAVRALADALLSAGVHRVSELLASCRLRLLDEAFLRADAVLARHDPRLESTTNLNDAAAYAQALARDEPSVSVLTAAGLESLVRAATMAGALAAAGIVTDAGTRLTLNGEERSFDPEEPLAEGDLVSVRGGATRS